MATKPQTPSSKPQPLATVASAEAVIAALERDRAVLVAARTQDDAELQKNAYASRVLHKLGASNTLREIADRARGRDQRLREIEAALVTAQSVLQEAQWVESKAQAREVARELLKRAARVVEHAQSLDDANVIRVEASCAIAEELTQMRSLAAGVGVRVPNHEQYLALGSRADLTATMQTPFAREVGEHLPPNQRRTHVSYLAQWSDQIAKACAAVLGEQPNKERAA